MGFSKKPIDVAVDAAKKAGRLLLSSYGKLRAWQVNQKAKNDFVTDLDKRSEKLILETIRKSFPGDRIHAEESGFSRGGERLWIIDPLDGTSNYIHQLPAFCVSIGVQEGNCLTTGVIYDPTRNELFTAERGRGARLNGKKFRATSVHRLADALMATGFPFRARDRFSEYLQSFKEITLATVGMRRGGSAALDLAYVACGRFDGFWEMDLSPWDIAAGAVIVEEAGGKISDFWDDGGYLKSGDTLASNGRIHKELVWLTSRIFTRTGRDKTCPSA